MWAPPRTRSGARVGADAALAVVALMLAATVALLAAPLHQLARVLPVEDGFYTLSVARELGSGHGITVDGVTATNGFQPLWGFLVAPFAALAGGGRAGTLRWALVLGTVLWLAFVPLAAALARERARRAGLHGDLAAALAAIVVAGSVSFLRIFHNVLETGLLLVLLAAAVLVLDRVGRWTPARALGVGVLLAAVAWARLDAVAFVAAAGAAAAWRARRRGERLALPLAACALAGLLLVPWLVRNLSLDGHVVPTSGRAEAPGAFAWTVNADAVLRALGAWSLVPAFHPSMHAFTQPWSELVAAAGVALSAAAAVWLRGRPAHPAPGPGTVALGGYCAFLAVYYTFGSGAWWFADRYLAPFALLAVPWLAAAAEGLVPAARRRAAPVAAAALVVALNAPLVGVLIVAPAPQPESWASELSNLATHPNLNYDQAAWTLAHVRPDCRVGAFESGTLGYFRDRVTNLDGKMDSAALAAREAHRTPAYVRAHGIQVLVDIASGIHRAAPDRANWRVVADFARFHAWVRRGAEGCVR
jgi:hypothetical protein